MEPIRFSIKNDEIHIDDYPDAVKVIKLNFNPKIKRLASLALNLNDLIRAKQVLSDINQVSIGFLWHVLWDYAITIFIRCFDNAISRNNLNYKKVYADDELEKEKYGTLMAMEQLRYIVPGYIKQIDKPRNAT